MISPAMHALMVARLAPNVMLQIGTFTLFWDLYRTSNLEIYRIASPRSTRVCVLSVLIFFILITFLYS